MFKIDSKELQNILTRSDPYIKEKNSEITNCVNIFSDGVNCYVRYANSDVRISEKVDAFEGEINITAPHYVLSSGVKYMEGDINITVKDNQVVYKNGRKKLKHGLMINDISELFIERESVICEFNVNIDNFHDALKRGRDNSSKNDVVRSYLEGVRLSKDLGNALILATDGAIAMKHSLSDSVSNNLPDVTIPANNIQTILTMHGDVKVSLFSGSIKFSNEKLSFYSPLLEDKFPQAPVVSFFSDIDNLDNLKLYKNEVLDFCRLCNTVSTAQEKCIVFSNNGTNECEMFADMGNLVDVLQCNEDVTFKFGVNHFKLSKILSTCSDNVIFKFNKEKSMLVIDDDECKYVLMTMRIR